MVRMDSHLDLLTVKENNQPELSSIRGELLKPPYKNPFRGPSDLIFSHNFDWGTKITKEIFFEIGF